MSKFNSATGSVVDSLVSRFIDNNPDNPASFACACAPVPHPEVPSVLSVVRPKLKRVIKRKKKMWTSVYMRHIGDWARNQKMPFKEAINNPRLPAFPDNLKDKDGPNKNFLRYYYGCGRKWDWDDEKDANLKARCNYFAWADQVIDKAKSINSHESLEEADALKQIFDYSEAEKVYKFDNMYLPERLVNQVENVLTTWSENEQQRQAAKGDEGENNEGDPSVSEERVDRPSATTEHIQKHNKE